MDNEIVKVALEGVYASGAGMGFRLGFYGTGGFGKIGIFIEDGVTYVDSEHMSKEFVIAVLTKLVNDAELVD